MIVYQYCEEFKKEKIPKSCINSLPCSFHKLVFLDKSSTYRLTSNCSSVSEMVPRTWFVLPPKAGYYYKQRVPNYRVMPSYKEGCVERDELSAISVLYPTQGSKIVLKKNTEGQESKIIFEAVHRKNQSTLYWHLDEKYMGLTDGIHQLELTLPLGKHVLKVLDELGNSEKIVFEVVKD